MPPKSATTKKSIEETYKSMTQYEHILHAPDTYIGSVENTELETWVYNEVDDKMEFRNIKYVPGLHKIFDEILVNALDQHVRIENNPDFEHKVTYIKVHMDIENNVISVTNSGEGIPVVIHKEHNVYVPELVFGTILSGSNYDKEEKKITGGKNGMGSTLTNIYSDKFTVETVDSVNKLKYVQVFEKNMSIKHPPTISKCSAKPYTKIEFSPDLSRFGLTKLDGDDTIHYMKKRVIDATACTKKSVNVFLNEKKIDCKGLDKYVSFYLGDKVEKFYEEVNDRWEVVVAVSPEGKFDQMSFVNGVATIKGGKHVDNVVTTITNKLIKHVESKRGKVVLKPSHVKENMFIFVKSVIENPAFDSQTKEYLTTPATKFGSKCEVSDKFIEKLGKSNIVERAQKLTEFKQNMDLQKATNLTKRESKKLNIPKLDEANMAGTAESLKCTIILTEGDSAKGLAVAGLSVVGRDYFGAFPLKGKPLNVRDVKPEKIRENQEIVNIAKILGLPLDLSNKKRSVEETKAKLRYGRVMIFADQDLDGFHIKGLLINLFDVFWPELLDIPDFIIVLSTPIVKAFKGSMNKPTDKVEFYSIPEYEEWLKNNQNGKGFVMKYYKGLGTSTAQDAKEYFEDFEVKKITYSTGMDKGEEIAKISRDAIDLAFNSKRAEDRKEWLGKFDKNNSIKQSQKQVKIDEFINRDLIQFSNYDNDRSIPSVCDGLKPSQRKILYAAFKKNLVNQMKVAQFSGYVSAEANYHHGEASLNGAIVKMAQDFVGSNNINLLTPDGNFGCLDPETEILMWNGSIKKAKDICIGDQLIGDDGTIRNVLQLVSGEDEMYKITDEKNNVMIVNSEHMLTLYCIYNFDIMWKECNKLWYFRYFNGTKIEQISLVVNDNVSDNDHFNKSQITKEEGYKKIVELHNKYSKLYNTDKVIDIKIKDYMKLSKYNKRGMYQIYNTNAIEWEKQNVPIDPYIYGAWLGDGDHNGKGFTSMDIEVVQEFIIWSKKNYMEISHHKNNDHDGYHYTIRRKGSGFLPALGSETHSSENCIGCKTSNKLINKDICDWKYNEEYNFDNNEFIQECIKNNKNPFVSILKDNALYCNKQILDCYIYNDKQTRLELLAGFIDTDGCIKRNNSASPYYEITQSERLHGNLIYKLNIIAQTLGFATRISRCDKNRKTLKGESVIRLDLAIYGNNLDIIPVKIERKKIIYNGTPDFKIYNYKKFNIEPIGVGKFNGWQLDKNERFLLGNFIVTHNCRLMGGKDSASERYIFTRLNEVTKMIFNKNDTPLLKQIMDDGDLVEPEYYVPILPMILVNGTTGIGTGYSTDVPMHNPLDIIENLEALMEEKETKKMKPWYRGFTGTIEEKSEKQYMNKGVVNIVDDTTIEITELPIESWTSDYKIYLEALIVGSTSSPSPKAAKAEASGKGEGKVKKASTHKQVIQSFKEYHTDSTVKFELKMKKEDVTYYKEHMDELYDYLKLTGKINYSNMTLYDSKGHLKKYDSTDDILKEFYMVRYGYYIKRKAYMLKYIKRQLDMCASKVRFIEEIMDKTLDIMYKEDEVVEKMLEERNYPRFGKEEDDMSLGEANPEKSYDYLLHMQIRTFTKSKLDTLRKEHLEKEGSYKELEATSEIQMWKNDLNEFKEEYKKMMSEYEERYEEERNKKVVGTKSKVVKKRVVKK